MFSTLIQFWRCATRGGRDPRPRRTTRRSFRPCLEVFEGRCLLSTTATMASPTTLRVTADQPVVVTGGSDAYQVSAGDLVNANGLQVPSESFTGVKDIEVYTSGTTVTLNGRGGSSPLAGSVSVVGAGVNVIENQLNASRSLQVINESGVAAYVTANPGTTLGGLWVNGGGGGLATLDLKGLTLTGNGTLTVLGASLVKLTMKQCEVMHWVDVEGDTVDATLSDSTLGSAKNSGVRFTSDLGDDITVGWGTVINGNFTVQASGIGPNDVSLNGITVNGDTSVAGGGDGLFSSQGSILNGGLDVNFGSATAPCSITLCSDWVNGKLWVQTGAGNDTITLQGTLVGPSDQAHFATTATVETGQGTDTVIVEKDALGNPTIFYPSAPQFNCLGSATLKLEGETLATAFPNTVPKGRPTLSANFTIS